MSEQASSGSDAQESIRAFRPRNAPRISLGQLSHTLGLQLPAGHSELPLISGVSLDSRAVLPGDLYVALPGAAHHGADFAAAALSSGAAAILTDERGLQLLAQRPLEPAVPVLTHAEPRAVVGAVSALVYGNFPGDSLTRFAITGTNGKTTTSYFINSLLRALGHTPGLIGTIEIDAGAQAIPSVLTTPESPAVHSLMALMKENGIGAMTMEVSSHAIEFQRVAGLVFDIAGFTNLTQDHLDLHGSMQAYFQTKARLFTESMARHGVIVVGDEWAAELARTAPIPVTTLALTPGQDHLGHDADWRLLESHSRGALGTDFVLAGREGERLRAHVGLPGDFNVANAALALIMVLNSGVSLAGLQAALDEHDPLSADVPGRMQLIATEPKAIVDFAHNADALERALDAVRDPEAVGRTILVFGATGDRDASKRPIMGATAAQGAQIVIVTDDDPHNEDPAQIRAAVLDGAREWTTATGAPTSIYESSPRADAIALAVRLARPEDVILVAGRGHEVWQEVQGVNLALDDREELRTALQAHGFPTFPAQRLGS